MRGARERAAAARRRRPRCASRAGAVDLGRADGRGRVPRRAARHRGAAVGRGSVPAAVGAGELRPRGARGDGLRGAGRRVGGRRSAGGDPARRDGIPAPCGRSRRRWRRPACGCCTDRAAARADRARRPPGRLRTVLHGRGGPPLRGELPRLLDAWAASWPDDRRRVSRLREGSGGLEPARGGRSTRSAHRLTRSLRWHSSAPRTENSVPLSQHFPVRGKRPPLLADNAGARGAEHEQCTLGHADAGSSGA